MPPKHLVDIKSCMNAMIIKSQIWCHTWKWYIPCASPRSNNEEPLCNCMSRNLGRLPSEDTVLFYIWLRKGGENCQVSWDAVLSYHINFKTHSKSRDVKMWKSAHIRINEIQHTPFALVRPSLFDFGGKSLLILWE